MVVAVRQLQCLNLSRFLLTLIVALLTFSASGVSTVVVVEPCSGFQQNSGEDRDCPPTCMTCGCCAQAVEPALVLPTSPDTRVDDIDVELARLVKAHPRPVLHVPKSSHS
jgi:hypothetical protein